MTSRTRLAVVVSGFPRRSETFALNELLALEERHLLSALFATKPGEDGPQQPGYVRLAGRLEILPDGSPAKQGEALAARLAGQGVSGIHAYFAHTPAEVAEHAARRLSVPFGFSVHARDARKVDPAALGGRAQRAACVVACNTDVASEIGRAGGRAHVVPHGVDLRRFLPMPAPEPRLPLRVLAVGRLVEKKGFDVLIEALASLEYPFTLRIVGTGPERSRLESLVAGKSLSDRVVFVGAQTHEELPDEYARCHVVAVPSVMDAGGDRDGLPNVVLEAMASGRPVVATRVGAIESAVKDGETGWLVPARDPNALRDALSIVAWRAGWRECMGRRGRREAERNHDLRQCSSCFARLLEAAYA